jgi:hypothetical protein
MMKKPCLRLEILAKKLNISECDLSGNRIIEGFGGKMASLGGRTMGLDLLPILLCALL